MRIVMLIFLAFCFSCQEEANPRFSNIEVAINGASEVAVSDSIYFITADTLPDKVTVVSEASDANIVPRLQRGGLEVSYAAFEGRT